MPPPGTNLVVLRGVLSRDPEPRQLPSGDAVVAYDVTVRPESALRRARRGPSRCRWPGSPRRRPAGALSAGDDVVVVGRVRRRFFRAGGATASRTEVVATRVVPARSAAQVRAALGVGLDPLREARRRARPLNGRARGLARAPYRANSLARSKGSMRPRIGDRGVA